MIKTKSLETALIAMNAALYAGLGYMTFLGIFAPVVGTVRFWPVVIIPGLFTIIFSPRIGALGAGLGIFISDLLIHGDAFLSLTVGVPANLAGFYLLGKLYHTFRSGRRVLLPILQAIPLILVTLIVWTGILDPTTSLIYTGAAITSLVIGIGFTYYRREHGAVIAASTLGLLVGATIIGLGVWLYSQFFTLPPVAGGGSHLPLTAAAALFLFTYLTEIPFLVIILPILITAIRKALPAREVEAGPR
jgi:uncharacterized membrane protein